MKLSRIRTGERLALAGGIALPMLLCFNWFFLHTPDARLGAHQTGWRSIGWFVTFLLLASTLAALSMVFTTATQRAQAWPIVLTVFTFVLGTLGTLAVAIRFVAQPGLGVDASDGQVDLELSAWLGLLSIAAIALGGWLAMLDERTDTAEAREQTEEVLRVRGAVRPPAPREPAAEAAAPEA